MNNNLSTLFDESNDTFSTALDTGLNSDNPGRFTGSGFIGDNENVSFDGDDIDLLQFQLDAGERATVDIDASAFGSSLDPVLRLFDVTGRELAVNDDSDGLDSFIDFTASRTGTYYAGISSFANFDYDPTVEGSGNGGSTGEYDVILRVRPTPTTNEIFGTNASESLRGSNQRDQIFGLGGRDNLQGFGGTDIISGGNGNDTISGGNGIDILSGDNGRDNLSGGGNSDTLDGGFGNDTLDGGAGNDNISGGNGRDFALGGNGNDDVKGGNGNDTLLGGNGRDTLSGGNGSDTIIGGNGNDTLVGGNDNDAITGGSGRDIITGVEIDASSSFGTGEIDTLTGQSGGDTFVLGDETRVYYDDGDATTAGNRDRAIITDFNARQDVIQLFGDADLYRLDFFSAGAGATSANILFEPGASAVGEVIATLQDVSPSLSLTDSSFVFV